MLALRFLLMALGVSLFSGAVVVVVYDIAMAAQLRWLLGQAASERRTKVVARKAARKIFVMPKPTASV